MDVSVRISLGGLYSHVSSFEDFAECFPLYVEEDKNGSSATFNSISDYIEAQNFVCYFLTIPIFYLIAFQRDLDKLFKDYSVHQNIDTLHNIVSEAKDRKSQGNIGNDTWKPDLDPKVAVCSRTIPVLASEVERLKAMLAEVCNNPLIWGRTLNVVGRA